MADNLRNIALVMNATQFSIIGRRSSGEIVYLCFSSSQGLKFIPNAISLAKQFDTRLDAHVFIYNHNIAENNKGLELEVIENN